VTIVIALGAHRPWTKRTWPRRRRDRTDHVDLQSTIYENLVHKVRPRNRYLRQPFLRSRPQIGLSFITSHPMAGFGEARSFAGAGRHRNLDAESISWSPGPRRDWLCGRQQVRAEIEDVARKAGLNSASMPSATLATAGIFAEIWWPLTVGPELAMKVYATPAPPLDIGIPIPGPRFGICRQ
jgi:hypothetical protein